MQKKAPMAGVLVVILGLFVGCGKIDERVMATPQIRQSDPNRLFILSDFAAKALYTQDQDKKWFQSPSDNLSATVQWHAMLTNVTAKVARCRIRINLRDGDGFVLGEINYTHSDDLGPQKASPIAGELEVKLGVVRHLKSIEVAISPLPSTAEEEAEILRRREAEIKSIEAELANRRKIEEEQRQQQEAQMKAEQLAKAEKEAQRQADVIELKAKWDSLRLRMSKDDVVKILGQPSEIRNFRWYYGSNFRWLDFNYIRDELEGWHY